MKKNLLFIFLLLFSVALNAQTKKVLLEEYTGAHCSQCPLGTHYVDSMLSLHPNLITVALHAYNNPDAMFFAEIDTLYDTYSQGAPLGAVDRICTGSSSGYTAIFATQWNARIQQQLSVPAALTVSIVPSWNSSTRNITAQVGIDIYSNMPAGDYRLGMYVVEDSVTGTGFGYDQSNIYNQDPNSPYFGMGDPIIGFIHRHVARAVLPSSWGLQGLIPSSPVTGQNFNHTFNYTLPASYNENHVHLVAFVYKFTGTHTGDEVLNVSEEKLLQGPAGVLSNVQSVDEPVIYPNPASKNAVLQLAGQVQDASVTLYDMYGKKMHTTGSVSGTRVVFNCEDINCGLYLYKVIEQGKIIYSGKLMVY